MSSLDKTVGQNPVRHKHQCAICPYSTKILQNYKHHMKTHSSEQPFKCPECPYRTKWKHALKKHVENVHLFKSLSSRPFPCSHSGCSYAAKHKSNLTQHSKIHTDKTAFSCSHSDCNFSTKHKQSLIKHTRIHTGEKPHKCPFESCSYATATSGDLVVHTRTHTKEQPYKCPEANCNYTTNQKSNLNRRSLDHEPKAGKKHVLFSCPIESCEYSTKHKAHLSYHLKTHSLKKYFACSFESCEFRCNSKSNLSHHLQSHSEERRYKCELCPFRAKTRQVVTIHLKLVHSDPNFRPFKCPEANCDSGFKRKNDCQKHVLIHSQEKKYPCSFPDCEYRANRKSHVKNHEYNIHSEEKKEKCTICGLKCKNKSQLTSHIRTHTKEEPYKCKQENCEYRAKTSGALIKHKQKNHL